MLQIKDKGTILNNGWKNKANVKQFIVVYFILKERSVNGFLK